MGRKTVESLFDLFMGAEPGTDEEKRQPALPPMELITETATYSEPLMDGDDGDRDPDEDRDGMDGDGDGSPF